MVHQQQGADAVITVENVTIMLTTEQRSVRPDAWGQGLSLP